MQRPGNEPLHDWDELSSSVAHAYFPHRLDPQGRGSRAEGVRVTGLDLGPIRLAEISWGAPVMVHTAHEGGFAVNLPLYGGLSSRIGTRHVQATPAQATIYPPDTEISIVEWPADCRILGVRIDADHLRQQAERLFARPVTLPDGLATRGLGQEWRALVQQVTQTPASHPLVREQLAGAITTAFLLAAVPEQDGAAACPRIVRRVIDAVHADPAQAWTASEMAAVAGVGVRRLQEGFRDYLGMSPREYLTQTRLQRVRADLQCGDDASNVTDIAMRWGFGHLGRFAAQYRSRFGESPSETLRAFQR